MNASRIADWVGKKYGAAYVSVYPLREVAIHFQLEQASMKSPRPGKRSSKIAPVSAASNETAFAEVVEMIQAARGRALAAVNTELVELY